LGVGTLWVKKVWRDDDKWGERHPLHFIFKVSSSFSFLPYLRIDRWVAHDTRSTL
jgi:hypothetical protein